MPKQPEITGARFGRITVGKKTYEHDVYIRADGEVKKRKKSIARAVYGSSHSIGPGELKKVCKGDPEIVFVGLGQSGLAELTEEAHEFLRARNIAFCALPTPQAVEAYNESTQRKAALIHVTC